METKINIAEILKDKPKRTKLYTDTFGELSIEDIYTEDELGIVLSSKDNDELLFYNDGRYNVYGEPILFPSKEMRDWSKFAWKKGDVLIMDGYRVVFDKWLNDDYTRFNAVHLITSIGGYIDKPLQNRYSPISNFITRIWRKMTDAETKIYMDSLERECGGKLNLDTLEIEKQPEFKDGDIVVYGKSVAICRRIYKHTLSFYVTLNEMVGLLFADEVESSEEYRFATDEDKLQLFDALAKEGKVWDAEKKVILDLKLKVELKPFDNVLVRHQKTEEWRANIFSHTDKTDEYLDYVCVNGRWEFCIPYEGNESLLGTTNNVEG